MAELIPFDKNANLPTELSDLLGGSDANDDLSSGVTGGFSVISFRGSKWRVKHSGEETLITDSDGDAVSNIKVVMLKANPHISKNYYASGYVEGSTDAPDCFSVNGVKPDPSVENPVNPVCASCPNNQFGSRITDTGSKAKACSDSRRVAVVPEGDYENERFNGPMLLRVPAASLTELASFGKAMKAKGFPYNTIVTKLAFDGEAAYPKLKFSAFRPLNQEEASEIAALVRTAEYRQKIDYILAEPIEVAETAEEPTPAPKKEDPTEFEAQAPEAEVEKPKKKAEKPKAKAEKPKAKPEPESTDLDDDLQDILSKLDDLD